MSHSQDNDSALTVGQRIEKLRGPMAANRFAELLGFNRKTVARWEDDQVLPDAESLLVFWEKLQVSPGWILTGDGPPPPLSHREANLLAAFRLAPLALQDAALRALDGAPIRTTTQNFHGTVGAVTQGDTHITGGKFTQVTSAKGKKRP